MAKLDKAPAYEAEDYRFESCRVRHLAQRVGEGHTACTSWVQRVGSAPVTRIDIRLGEVAERLKALPC